MDKKLNEQKATVATLKEQLKTHGEAIKERRAKMATITEVWNSQISGKLGLTLISCFGPMLAKLGAALGQTSVLVFDPVVLVVRCSDTCGDSFGALEVCVHPCWLTSWWRRAWREAGGRTGVDAQTWRNLGRCLT